MKITKTIFIAALMSFFFSCSSDSNEYTTTDNTTANAFTPKTGDSDSLDFYDIIEIEDLWEQVVVASALSPDAKRQLWQDKLSDYIDNNELNENQINYLNDFREELNVTELFDQDSEESISFLNERSGELFNGLTDTLGEAEATYLLTRVENVNQSNDRMYGDIGDPIDENPTPDTGCDCGGYLSGGGSIGCVKHGGLLPDGRVNWIFGNCNHLPGCTNPYLSPMSGLNTGRCSY